MTALLCLFLLWGCPEKEPEQPVLTANQIKYTIGADGGDIVISFMTNQNCTVRSEAFWLKESTPTTRAVRTENVTLTATANTSEKERTATVTVTGGTLSITLEVTQSGKVKENPDTPTPPDPEEPDLLQNAGAAAYNIPFGGGSFSVKVQSNVNYSYSADADWITQTKAKATKEDNIDFTVAANQGGLRTAKVTFSFGDVLSFAVTVRQESYRAEGEEIYLEISPEDITASPYGGEYTVQVNTNSIYDILNGVDWIEVVEAGETCVLQIAENSGDDTRETELFFVCEDIERSLTVSQAGVNSNTDPFDIGSDLSKKGTANCYVVVKPGKFSFDATAMGNGEEGFLWEDSEAETQYLWPLQKADVSFTNYGNDGPSKVSVLWDDGGVITDVSIDKLKVSFTATGNKGSALIGAYNRSNEFLWSWHIWCTDSPRRIRHESMDGTEIVMLDRNLGATSVNPSDGAATYGYWYQWGRKDPLKLFPEVAKRMVPGQQSMQHSVEHPTAIYIITGKSTEWFNGDVTTITSDLWGNPYAKHNGADHLYQATMAEMKKTIYDPCPPGYMVPPEWAWDNFTMDDCEVSDYGLTFTEDNGESFYPFAGFGDSGDSWGGDSGWYGYPGYTPRVSNLDGKYHHNCRNVVCVWSSSAAKHYDPQYDATNYQHAHMFYYLQDEEASSNNVMVNADSEAHLYPRYSHIRERCCSVRCMKIQ